MRNRLSLLLTLLVLFFVACTKANLVNTYAAQEKKIESFIENQLKADTTRTVVRQNGVNRLILNHGSGEVLSEDGNLSFYYAGYTFTGSISASNMFTTNKLDVAKSAKWDTSDSTRFFINTINLKDEPLVSGLKKGLVGVKGGETCYIIFSGEHGFGTKGFGMIPANSALVYQIWAESVSNE